MNEYSYKELRAAALEHRFDDKANETAAELAEWFEAYGSRFWNGESYNIGDGYSLFPVYDWDSWTEDSDEPAEIIGWEIR